MPVPLPVPDPFSSFASRQREWSRERGAV